jgi:hypothetical protein
MKRCCAVIILVLAGIAGTADAATVCVSTANGIQSALNIAAANGQDDVIAIVGGSYPLSTKLTFNSTEAHSLALVGGWNAGCTINTGMATTLNGQHAVQLLEASNSNGSIEVSLITFVAGTASNAIVYVSSNIGSAIVDRNIFVGNRSLEDIGALTVYVGGGGVRVRENLVVANRGGLLGGIFVSQESGESYITGNTIVSNTSDAEGVGGGLFISGGHFTISNNIIWNNAGATGSDFSTQAAHSRFNNDIGLVGIGAAPDQMIGEQYVDPQFASCGFLCFELAWDSPLVDAGVDAPAAGQLSVDLVGKPRKLGAHVDIGAYENEVIFVDGFEP